VLDPLSGTQLGGFRIEQLLGRGGMSRVYRAEQVALGRMVALKLLPIADADADYVARFVRESRLAASIDHPNILPIYDSGEAGGYLFIAMRLVEGADLRSVIERDGPLSLSRAALFISQAAAALDSAHARGLIHRDVKPANFLISGEHLYLTDFGIAKVEGGARGLTRTGLFVGTPDFASPEQILQGPVDGRSDVYSLGCVLYACLMGQGPFDRPTEHAVIEAHLHEAAPSLRLSRPELPASLDAVIGTALAKEPDLRYRTAGHFAAAVRATFSQVDQVPLRANPTVIQPRAAAWPPGQINVTPAPTHLSARGHVRRNVALAVGMVVLVSSITAVAGYSLQTGGLSGSVVASASPQPTATATASPTPTSQPIPTIRQIAARPQDLVMPPSEFPYTGYSVTHDTAVGSNGWRRDFSAKTLDYYYLQLYVFIYPPGTTGANQLTRFTCDFTWDNPPYPVPGEVTAEVIGDGAKACRYHWEGTIPDWFEYITATRNAIVIAAGEPRRPNITDAAAMNQMISLARQQIAILERVAPR